MNKLFKMENIDKIPESMTPVSSSTPLKKLKETAMKSSFECNFNFENELTQLNKNFISDQILCKF